MRRFIDNVNYNFIRDIVPAANIDRVPNVMAINPSVPVKTVAEFIAYAKANPGKINMASGGNGTSKHIAGELFKMMTGISMQHVPYQGLDQRPSPACHQGHPPRDAPARRHRTRHRPPQGGSPHGPQLSHRPRWRSHQRGARRCRLQLQPAPALVRGAFTRPLVDPLARPLGRPASPNPVPENFLHGRPSTSREKV